MQTFCLVAFSEAFEGLKRSCNDSSHMAQCLHELPGHETEQATLHADIGDVTSRCFANISALVAKKAGSCMVSRSRECAAKPRS